ncbi:MAG: hypothetical protein K5695_04950 [Oscillospiraceae bacterium]|nr:hypothetical protein [Oscillospiraceae bacterium]
MIRTMIQELYTNTNDSGILLLHDTPRGEEISAGWRFRKCRMHWKDTDELIHTIEELCLALEDLAEYYRTSGEPLGSCPKVYPETEEDPELAQTMTRMIVHWMLWLDGYDLSDPEVIAELNEKVCGHEAVVRMHRYCRVLSLQAPSIIAEAEKHHLIQAYVLRECCESSECADLSQEPYRDGQTGCFDRQDLTAVFRMLHEDSSLLPEPETGYVLLVSDIFSDCRSDLMCRIKEVRKAVDKAHATLLASEQEILRLRYGLDDGVRMRVDEIALRCNRPTEVVREKEAHAMRKLRHPSRSRKLAALL